MHLTPEKIRDYEACARYYDFQYGEGAKPLKLTKRQQMSDDFLATIQKVANFYLYKKQSFNDPTLKSLFNRWQRDWYGDLTAVDIATMQNSVQQRSKTSFSSRAIEVIKLIYDDFESVSGDQVFLLNEDFLVPILDRQVNLAGTIDLVIREKEKNRYHIFKWADSSHPSHHYKYDLAASEYAFRIKYNMDMETRHYLWYFYGARLGRQEIKLEKKDFDLMGHYAHEIMNDEICAPRLGYSTYCKSCRYANRCAKWQFPAKERVIADE